MYAFHMHTRLPFLWASSSFFPSLKYGNTNTPTPPLPDLNYYRIDVALEK